MTTWTDIIKKEKEKSYFISLKDFLKQERDSGAIIYPPSEDIFKALQLTPLSRVKVVILGQDPYHAKGQAHGLSFSVPHRIKKPPSLVNILKERKESLKTNIPASGNLESWAKDGILLLNTILTVEEGMPGSHKNKGWEPFTDKIISTVNKKKEPVVFCLWGAHAQTKEDLITNKQHIILKAPHPSPLSAYKGFFGCGHFDTIAEAVGWTQTKDSN